MHRARLSIAAALLLTVVPGLAGHSRPAHAATGIGTARTDFTKVTPATADLYAAIQPTSADQTANLAVLGQVFTAQPGFQQLLQRAMGGSGSNAGSMASMVVTQVENSLTSLFNGEVGFAALPPTTAANAQGKMGLRLHLLVAAGLQPGVTAGTLAGALMVLLPATPPTSTYHGVQITSLDLNASMAALNPGGKHHGLAADGPISSVLSLAVIGNEAVVATDLPTMQAAIDTANGSLPSIAANQDFQSGLVSLPNSRIGTLFVHYDRSSLAALARSLHHGPSTASQPAAGTYSQAFAVSAEPDGMLFTAGPAQQTGALAHTVSLSPLTNATAATLPQDTLSYATVNDPGTLVRSLLDKRNLMGAMLDFPIKPLDPVKLINRLLGLDLDKDILAWMHGEAAMAVLPVGSDALARYSPAAKRLSFVGTLQVQDQSLVDSKIQELDASVQGLSTDPAGLQLVSGSGPNGAPQRLLAATPGGIGYTFINGSLVTGTALPADVAALQAVSPTSNLTTNPLYTAALRYAVPGKAGGLAFANLTGLRQVAEQIAQDRGTNLTRYKQVERPFLAAFTSLLAVANPGANAGGILFIGIGK